MKYMYNDFMTNRAFFNHCKHVLPITLVNAVVGQHCLEPVLEVLARLPLSAALALHGRGVVAVPRPLHDRGGHGDAIAAIGRLLRLAYHGLRAERVNHQARGTDAAADNGDRTQQRVRVVGAVHLEVLAGSGSASVPAAR